MTHAGAVHRVAGGKVVAAVEHYVGLGHPLFQRVALQALGKRYHRHLRVDRAERRARGLDLQRAHGIVAVQDLALQVGEVDTVGIRQREAPDSARGEVERRRAAQAAGADDQRVRSAQP